MHLYECACICVHVFSYMEATLLNMKELQSKCLYAAHYPPLVANQGNPNSSYITVKRRILTGLKLGQNVICYPKKI